MMHEKYACAVCLSPLPGPTQACRNCDERERSADVTEALAEAWASIDGRLDRFRSEKGKAIKETTGAYEGYMEDARELQKRLHDRGYVLTKGH